MKSWLASLGVLLTGIAVLWLATDGGVIWTAESARRDAITNTPLQLPGAMLRNDRSRLISLQSTGKPLALLSFIYTQCPTVCVTAGYEFRKLQSELNSRGLDEQVALLSITFDQLNDGPAELASYLSKFSINSDHWRAARFEQDDELNRVLDMLGVIVIPEPTVGFVHNAAIYLVNEDRVVGAYDLDDQIAVIKAVEWQLSQT